MTNLRTVATVFVALTVIFAAATGYFLVSPNNVTVTQTTTQISTTTVGSGARSPTYTVDIGYSSNASIGFYLTNGTGWTLYLFKADKPNNGTSACYDKCAKVWPPFYVANLRLSPGLNASSFATITRTDGTKQLTYNGYPLYYFAPDKKAGDTKGQGVGKVWYAYSLPRPSSL